MKRAQVTLLVGALVMSSLAMAEGGGDKAFERMMATQSQAMEKYAANEAKRDPVVVNDAKTDKAENTEKM
ncbi:hypothetical protein NYP20_18040 [Pseudomonas sp. N3-W]|uniref:co-regulatory protein PtrA N-terminal domain-containing protein n=1 Tax=Pseudomonas sp. N3-W TaxID=2975049 RepID=UPI00217D3A84|nr:co-regulatory protein PtrA N-terminal domain-containing protein [Pseudomonas sp. N3-W]UWF47244.1 hypothetical protein NYP20_18040 [Pseudomonas sp. N3-W]